MQAGLHGKCLPFNMLRVEKVPINQTYSDELIKADCNSSKLTGTSCIKEKEKHPSTVWQKQKTREALCRDWACTEQLILTAVLVLLKALPALRRRLHTALSTYISIIITTTLRLYNCLPQFCT